MNIASIAKIEDQKRIAILDIWTEKGNDGAEYATVATQSDFDVF